MLLPGVTYSIVVREMYFSLAKFRWKLLSLPIARKKTCQYVLHLIRTIFGGYITANTDAVGPTSFFLHNHYLIRSADQN
jgi:hypothetical protein